MVRYNSRHKFKKQAFYKKKQASTGKKSLWIDKNTDKHTRLIALLFFVGIALIMIFANKTLISWIAITRIFAAIAVVTSFIPKKYFPVLYRVRKELKILFTVCALTPMLTGLVLTSNYLFIRQVETESYKVIKTESYPNDYIFYVHLENNVFDKYQSIRSFSFYDYRLNPDSAHFKTAKGLFGFKVVRKAYLTH